MGCSRQEYWSGLPCPPPGDLLNPGIKLASLILLRWQAGRFFTAVRKKERKKESEVTQLCLTLSDPMDCSQPGSSVHGFSRQEHWSRLPFSSPMDLPNLGNEPMSLTSPALTGRFFTTSATWEVLWLLWWWWFSH